MTGLPKDFSRLSSLQKLNLSMCTALQRLPSSLGLLRSLVHLYVCSCTQLKCGPSTFSQLTCLENLCLTKTSGAFFNSVPEDWHYLPGCDVCKDSDSDDRAFGHEDGEDYSYDEYDYAAQLSRVRPSLLH